MVSLPTLYLNENINPSLTDALAQYGIKAIHTLTVNNTGASDEFQLEYAAKSNYILVTHNRKHFKRLHRQWIEKGKLHAGILVIRLSEPEILAVRIKRFFDELYPVISPPFCVKPPP